MDLQDPTGKMGKTGSSELGTVRMLDEPDTIRKKFKSAVTDSGREVVHDRGEKPGVSNLIEIMEVATGESVAAIEERYRDAGYGTFKTDVGEAVVALLEPIQARYRMLRDDETELRRILKDGARRAAEVAAPTLEAMYDRMGFVQP